MESVQYYKGTVKAVASGDNIVVYKKMKSGAIKERNFFLSNIRTPKMGTNLRVEEPFAFEAREFLRSNLIGKVVTVREDMEMNERSYGTLFHDDKNYNLLLVKNGLAKVNEVKKESGG